MGSLLTDGLVGWWKFDEGTGTTAADSSGNSNTGTLVNSPSWTAPSNSQIKYANPYCLTFNGSNNYVSVANNSTLNFTTSTTISISLWAYCTNIATTNTMVIKGRTLSVETPNYAFRIDASKVNFFYRDSGNTVWQIWTSTNNVSQNSWNHLVVIFTFGVGSSINVFFNGVLQSGSWTSGTGNVTPFVNSEPLWIGADKPIGASTPTEIFNGSIDDVRIYNRALGADEVKALYNAEAKANSTAEADFHRTLSERGLIGHWKLDEGSGIVTRDWSGNGNGGTLVNTPTWSSSVPTTKFSNPYCLTLNGTSQYVGLGSSKITTSTTGTICGWTYFNNATNGTNNTVFCYGGASSSGNASIFQLRFDGNGSNLSSTIFGWDEGGAVSYVSSPANILPNTWVHWAVSSNGSAWTIYINGVSQALTPTGGGNTGRWIGNINPVAPTLTSIGVTKYNGTFGNYVNGSIDDVRIYNRALTSSEIAQLAAGYSPETKIGNAVLYGATIY